MTAVEPAAALLRRAADRVEEAAADTTAKGYRYAGVALDGDDFAALLTVPVASPLASWLRAEADQLERDGWEETEADYPATALALALLGETPNPSPEPTP